MSEQLVPIIRYALMILGTWLASSGHVSEGDWSSISGALLTLITVGWAMWVKVGTVRVPEKTLTPTQKEIVAEKPVVQK